MFSSVEEAEKERDGILPKYKQMIQQLTEKKKGEKREFLRWKGSSDAHYFFVEFDRIKGRLAKIKEYVNANRPQYIVDHDILISRLVEAIHEEAMLKKINLEDTTRDVVGMAIRYLRTCPTVTGESKL